jgi:hypothetical protein
VNEVRDGVQLACGGEGESRSRRSDRRRGRRGSYRWHQRSWNRSSTSASSPSRQHRLVAGARHAGNKLHTSRKSMLCTLPCVVAWPCRSIHRKPWFSSIVLWM